MEGYGDYVEILGSRFPAVNIQIWPNHPDLWKWEISGDTYWFGAYFEMMFESGTYVVVRQEAAQYANGEAQTECLTKENYLENYLVELFPHSRQTLDPSYVWHCSDEEELLSILQTLKTNISAPNDEVWETLNEMIA